jgi:hypothetical protein
MELAGRPEREMLEWAGRSGSKMEERAGRPDASEVTGLENEDQILTWPDRAG